MKKLSFLGLCMVLVFGLFTAAQGQLLLQESFETGPGSGYSVTPAFCDYTTNDFCSLYTDANKPSGLAVLTGSIHGSQFVAGEDMNYAGGCLPSDGIYTITLDALTITGYSGLTVTIALNAKEIERYDQFSYSGGDYVQIFRNIDSGGDVEIGRFCGFGGYNTELGIDTDLDGFANDSITDYANLQDYTFDVGATGNSMVVKIVFRMESGDEEIVFDNIRVNGGTDTDPPDVVSASAVSATQVDVFFDEDVDQTTGETTTNYLIDLGIGNPSAASRDAGDNSIVHLTVSSMTMDIYELHVAGVEDLYSNAIVDTDTVYYAYAATGNPGDVRINEVSYDDIEGTDIEWVELFNTTVNPIDISGWYLSDDDVYPATGEGYLVVPTPTILDSYLVICKEDLPGITGEVVCTESGSIILGNSGDNLALYDAASSGQLIDGSLTVNYPDDAPSNTGESIEKIVESSAWSGLTADWDPPMYRYSKTGRYRYCTPGFKNSVSGPDIYPPYVDNALAMSATLVDVFFHEDVDQTTAETASNYFIDGGIGNPSVASRDAGDNSIVHLTVSSLSSGNTYEVKVTGVEDLNSNAITDSTDFDYWEAIGDIIITEFMANPNAAFDSDGEWFEVYNTTASTIDMDSWILKDNAGADTIEGTLNIGAGQYLVFCVEADAGTNGGVPEDYDYVYGSPWGLSLANAGDRIVIYDDLGQLQDSIVYDAIWGIMAGQAHELKDVTYENNTDTSWCIAWNPWSGSAGDYGTPGAANDCAIGDTTKPTIDRAAAPSATQVDVYFSEAVDLTTSQTTTNYSIDGGIGTPSAAVRDGSDSSIVHLTVSTLTEDVTYTITINNVNDINGNTILPNSQTTFVYAVIGPNDIIITEIMPNPAAVSDENGEWFEVYNTTGYPINMNGWILHDNSATSHTIVGDNIIASHDYFVFSREADSLTNGGVPEDYAGFTFYMNNTSSDMAKICTDADVVIDSVWYTTSWPFGNGSSMQLRDVALDNDVMANWCASTIAWDGSMGDFGSPGAAANCAVADTIPLTICQARAQDACGIPTYLDTLIRVKGVVSFNCSPTVFMQDDGCGLALYGSWTSTLLPGDSVQVTGYLQQYAGLAEIKDAFGYTPEFVVLNSGNTVSVANLGCSLISNWADTSGADSCTGEDYESERVQIDNITFLASGTFSPGDANYPATCVAGDTIQVRIDSCSAFLDQPIPDGPVDMVGHLSQYDWNLCLCQNYEIHPWEFVDVPCVDPYQLVIQRSDTNPEKVILNWNPNVGQTCDCYKIYWSSTPDAAFPGGWTELACVCSQTSYEHNVPISTTLKLFYRVTAVNSCP